MLPELLDTLERVVPIIVTAVLAPLVVGWVNRWRLKTEAESLDVESTMKLKDAAADLVVVMQKRIESLTARVQALEEDRVKLMASNERILKDLAEQHVINARLSAENSLLRKELEDIRRENLSLRAELADVKGQNEMMKNRIRDLESRKENCE